MTPRTVITIAGSDASGGAGLQADLRTLAALGVHGTTAVTALTAQNTVGVQGVHLVPADFVEQQLDSILADLDVAAVKTGMLGSAAVVERVAQVAAAGRLPNLVVDPVMLSSTGSRLLDEDAEAVYRVELVPRARIITPNRSEAAVLCDRELHTLGDIERAALHLAASGPEVVVVTGGGVDDEEVVDVVAIDGETRRFRAPRIDTSNDHGTGCSLASAIAARLAKGDPPVAAIEAGRAFVRHALAGAAEWRLGGGHGPIDHLGWSKTSSPDHLEEIR